MHLELENGILRQVKLYLNVALSITKIFTLIVLHVFLKIIDSLIMLMYGERMFECIFNVKLCIVIFLFFFY